MFKPVYGDELAKFDPETIELYRRRQTDPKTTYELLHIQRRSRHHLPIIVDKNANPKVVALEKEHSQFWWKFLLGFTFFCKYLSIHLFLYKHFGLCEYVIL